MAHIRKSPWERHLIAIKLIAGEKNNQLALTKRDESTAYKQAFQAWLKGKYRNLEALNKAWKTTLTDFDKALPLLRNEWPQGKMGYLADPENRHFIDSRLFYNESWAAYLNNLAASVKQYSHGRYLSISSNGPFALMSAHRQVQYSLAPAAFRKLLASPAFDVIEIDRDLMNLPLFAPLLRKHKKALMIHDADFPNREEADFFRKAALASGVYFSEIRKIPQFSENEMLLRKLPPASKAEIAIVIDPDSFLWSLPWSGESPGLQQAARAHYQFALPLQLAYEYGFPIDLKLINDPDLKNYKCLIFHHIPHLEDKFRKHFFARAAGS